MSVVKRKQSTLDVAEAYSYGKGASVKKAKRQRNHVSHYSLVRLLKRSRLIYNALEQGVPHMLPQSRNS